MINLLQYEGKEFMEMSNMSYQIINSMITNYNTICKVYYIHNFVMNYICDKSRIL